MDGILIVKKEKGYTSHDVVAKVKKITKVKVGHTGTLDPMATGVLPLLLGEGTKLSKYLIEHDKIYEAIVQLGKRTTTADIEGEITEQKEVDTSLFNKENIEEVLQSMVGKQMQTPPIYSAIKVKGKKLYEYARKNQAVEIPEREIEIYEIALLEYNLEEKTISFRVHCSKGTYIRSLCETIAEKLKTVGYMKELNRVKVGNYTISQAVSTNLLEQIAKEAEKQKENFSNQNKNNIENVEEKTLEDFLKEHIITIEQFFQNKQSITLQEKQLELFLNGVQLTRKEVDGIYRIYNPKKEFVGSGIIENSLLKRDIVVYGNFDMTYIGDG